MSLDAETSANFESFFGDWTKQASANWSALHSEQAYLNSYRRIAAFQALKIDILKDAISSESLLFIQEAHNDAIVSHVSASYGAWRSALKSLRSLIENSLAALYYTDHPIELRNWQRGKRRIGFSELFKYFEDHPNLEGIKSSTSGLDRIKTEYATLSKAVHASAVEFRMTDNVSQVMLWSVDKSKVGKWSTRERETLTGISQLIVALNRESLTGAQKSILRESLKYIFSTGVRNTLKNDLNINIS